MKQTLWNKPYSMKQNPWGYVFFSSHVQCHGVACPHAGGECPQGCFWPSKKFTWQLTGGGRQKHSPDTARPSVQSLVRNRCHVSCYLRYFSYIWTHHGDMTTCRSGACGGVRRGSAVIMTVAILTPRCRRPALLTQRDAAWPLRRAVLTRCDAAWSPRRRSDAAATRRAPAQWNVQRHYVTQVTSARHYITRVLCVFCYQLQVGTWALAWLRVGVIMTMHAWSWPWSWLL